MAKKIVKHADILSVMQYCQHEERLGNKNFIELSKATEKRLAMSRKELMFEIQNYKEEHNAKE